MGRVQKAWAGEREGILPRRVLRRVSGGLSEGGVRFGS